MSIAVTIGGVAHSLQIGWSISNPANGRSVLQASVASLDGTYTPAIDDEVIVTLDGTIRFGGIITNPHVTGHQSIKGTPIATAITASDYSLYADRRFIDGTISTGNLKAALTVIATYLPAGVTLDASQVNGPTLPELTYDYQRVSGALNDLASLTGYIWEIGADKKLRMFLPSASAAPFNIIDAGVATLGDVTVRKVRTRYANRVFLQIGTTSMVEKTETFTATAAQTSFPLTYPLNQGSTDPYRNIIGTITRNGVNFETVGSSGATWTYDYATNAVVRSSGVTAGQSVAVHYQAQFPMTLQAPLAASEPTAAQTARGVIEEKFERPDIFDATIGRTLVDGYLDAMLNGDLQEVEYEVYGASLRPGMSQTITKAARSINATFVLTDVETIADGHQKFRQRVRALEGDVASIAWQDFWRQRGSGANGSGSASSLPTIPSQSLIGWSTDETTRSLYPDDDAVRTLGTSTKRMLTVNLGALGSPSRGLQFRAADGTTSAYISCTESPAVLDIYIRNAGSGVTLTPLQASLSGINAVFVNAALSGGLRLFDASSTYETLVNMVSTLTANRTLSITTGDANRAITLSGNPTLADWFDQAVKTTSSPAFAAATVVPGSSAITARAGGVIYQSITAVGNITTGEDDLISQSIAANVLSANGQRLTGEFNGRFAANGNAKRIRLKFGSTTILDMGTGVAPNGATWRMTYTITRTGAATQRVSASLLVGGLAGPVFTGVTTAAETLSGAVTLKATGEATSTDDIINNEMVCEWKSA